MSNADYLKKVPIFAGLDESQLAEIGGRMGRRQFAKGVTIFHKGSPGQNLYVVHSGRVRIFAVSSAGQQLSLNSFGPGECFGEISMIDGQPRSAGAITTEDTVALTLHRQDFLRHIKAYPETADHMLKLLCARLRQTAKYAESLVFLDARSRIAAKLLDLAEQDVAATGNGDEGDSQVTQAVLATWVGVRRESVNRILADMRRQGIIRIENQVIAIADKARLKDQITY